MLDERLDQMRADESQWRLVRPERIDTWLNQYQHSLAELELAIDRTGSPDRDAVGITYEQIDDRGISTHFRAVIVALGNIRGELQTAFDRHRQANADQNPEIDEALDTNAKPWLAFSNDPKMRDNRPRDKPAAAGAAGSSKVGATNFPHAGKHQPPPTWFATHTPIDKAFQTGTAAGGNAKYLSRDPVTVTSWEQTSREEGLLLRDGFTILNRFPFNIGADRGQMTQCVRIDGDHGHPIVEHEPGLNTAFNTYIDKEVDTATADGNHQRLTEIATFLRRVGLNPIAYRIK